MSVTEGVINAVRRRLSELERKALAAIAGLDAIGAVWTSHTPQLDQGVTTDITKTIQYSKYIRIGNTVTWNFTVTATGAGTAGSAVTLSLPFEAAHANGAMGSGMLYDSSTATRYAGSVLNWITATVVTISGDWASVFAWGITPNLALANGDVIQGFVVYEAV